MRPYLLQHAFERHARRQPQRPAVCDPRGARLSYGELERESRRLAHRLRAQGLDPGARVGIWMQKSTAAVVALLATLRAGGVYVPFDPQAPAARVARLAANAQLRFLIADEELRARGGEALARLAPAPGGEDEGALPEPEITSDDLAYILYTSGSTGEPKGVMLTHAHALNFVAWAGGEFGVTADDRLASHAPFHFDLSIFDLWAGLGRGAEVCLLDRVTASFPAAVSDWVGAHRITVWYSVPSALVKLLPSLESAAGAAQWQSLRWLLFAGEPMPVAALARWRTRLPQARFANLYGPTETNVCTFYRVPALPAPLPDPLPIGRPCPNFVLELLDEERRPVAAGATGYLWVRGPGVFAGYWGDDALTAARTLPWAPAGRSAAGAPRLYDTGDRVSRGTDGLLYFHGRNDDLVKCRGYRIALGEVEAALLACPGARQAAVIARPSRAAASWLHAVVVGEPGLDAAQLRAFCGQRLPAYMIPERIEMVATLPETSTGKVDRVRLLALTSAEAMDGLEAA